MHPENIGKSLGFRIFTGSKEKAHREQMGYVRTGIFCKKKWKCGVKKVWYEPFFKITSRGNLKVAINWKLIKIILAKKFITLLIILSFEGAVTLSLNKIIVMIFMFLNLTLSKCLLHFED